MDKVNNRDLNIQKFKKILDKNNKNNSYNNYKKILSQNEINLMLNDINKNYNKNYKKYYEKRLIINKKNIDNLEYNIIKKVNIDTKINNLQDLIDIINKYPINSNIQYNINLNILNKIKDDLINLNNMIGLEDLKKNIINQILYYIQNLHSFDKNDSDFMHVVLYGPPGTGKTEVAKIIGQLFANINILKSNKFKKVTRADLVAGYLGQTALKTKNVIEDSLDGVLFIDEAYSLGNQEKRDSFAKECLDTLCESLSNYKERLIVIIAGYKEELDNCFFSYNSGLESRFIWRYNTDKYTSDELMKIFIKKVYNINWSINIENNILTEWFKIHSKKFKYYGRSIETLLTKTKISHSRRIFCKPINSRKKINLDDLDNGLELMNLEDDKEDNTIFSLYR
jgi:ATP-dependent 26S proteasome regulatory subunit